MGLGAMVAAAIGGRLEAAPWNDPSGARPALQAFLNSDLGTDEPLWCVLPAHDGYLYVGTRNVRAHNGENWIELPVPGTSAVQSLSEDATGRLWVGGRNEIGYFEAWHRGQRRYLSLTSRLAPEHQQFGNVWQTMQAGDGAVVFVAAASVIRVQRDRTDVWHLPAERRLFGWRDTDGTIFVAQPGVSTWRIGPSGPEPAGFPEAVAREGVIWRHRRSDGSALLVVGHRLVIEANGTCTPLETAASPILAEGHPTTFAVLPGGLIAIGTYYRGIVIVDPGGELVTILDRRTGLPSRNVAQLCVSDDNCLYVAANTAVMRVPANNTADYFDLLSGYPGGQARQIRRTPAGLALATDDGIFLPDTGQSPRIASMPTRAVTAECLGSLVSLSGRLIGSIRGGLADLTPDGPRVVHRTASSVCVMAASGARPNGLLWIEGRSLLRGSLRPGGVVLDAPPLTVDGDAQSIAEDAAGTVWIGTANAEVLRFAPPGPAGAGAPRRYALGGVGTTGGVQIILVGEHVIAAGPMGVFVYSRSEDSFVAPGGIRDVQVHAASPPDLAGRVWLSISQRGRRPFRAGVARLRVSPERALVCELVELPHVSLEQAPSALLAEPAPTGDGSILWLGLLDRLLRIEHRDAPQPSNPVEPRFDSVSYADPTGLAQNVELQGGTVPFAAPSVRIGFGVPAGRDRQHLHLEARLVGVDADWLPVPDAPERTFRGLRPGGYRFEVRSVDLLGRTSPPAAVTFTVLPAWYQTSLARGMLLALLGILLVVALYARVQIVRRRQHELEELVGRRTRELAMANAAKSEFLAHVNHEIRNPLNGVVGLAEMLARRQNDPTTRQLARSLKACADYLGAIVDNVLDLARIESGHGQTELRRFDARELLESVADIFRIQIQEGRGRISCETDTALPSPLLGDAHLIREVLVNFTANASRYARGSDVTLSARVLGPPAGGNLTVVFAVTDTGPGISLEDQARIFEKFARGRAAPGAARGFGIGLAMVRDLADVLGGKVGVESAPGRGASFTLTVPLAAAEPAERAIELPEEPGRGPIWALVVDDQSFNRVVLRDQLERLGCSVDDAPDGEHALRLLRDVRHQIAFIDLDLPGIDGLALIRRVRADITLAGTCLVATTAYATAHTEQTALEAGADTFIAKPLAPTRVAAILRECRQRHAARTSAPAAPIAALPEAPAPAPVLPVAGGLFAALPLTRDLQRDLARDLEFELNALAEATRDAKAEAARHRAHRLASLAIIARDETLLRSARAAEDALRDGAGAAPERVAALASAGRLRLEALRQGERPVQNPDESDRTKPLRTA